MWGRFCKRSPFHLTDEHRLRRQKAHGRNQVIELALSRRTLRLAALLIVAAGLAALGLRIAASRQPAAVTPTPGQAAPPDSASAPAASAFQLSANSLNWDWRAAPDCTERLAAYLKDYPIRSAQIVLTNDTPSLVIGAVYPDLQHPEANVRVVCNTRNPAKADRSDFVCQVAVREGQPGPALDVAATVAVAWGIKDFFRPRTGEAWGAAKDRLWRWEDFAPLIHKEGEGWQSDCLSLAKR